MLKRRFTHSAAFPYGPWGMSYSSDLFRETRSQLDSVDIFCTTPDSRSVTEIKDYFLPRYC